MKKKYIIILLSLVSLSVRADERVCATGPCPNPVSNCEYTLNEGMVTRIFEVWGDVRVTTNPYDADVWVYVVKSGAADMVVSWVDKPRGCGQWHKVDNGEDFSVYFTDEERFASFTIRYGDAAKEYPSNTVPY